MTISHGNCTLSDHVVSRLGDFLTKHGIPVTQHWSKWSQEHQQRHKEVIMAWYWTILYYSRQGSAIASTLTDKEAIQGFVKLAGTSWLLPANMKGKSEEARLVDLVDLLAHPPDTVEKAKRRDDWWSMMNVGTAQFNSWIAEGLPHWKRQDKNYSLTFKPATDAVMNLRCILLMLKLISVALSEDGLTQSLDPTLLVFMLWQMVEKPLNHINFYFEKTPLSRLQEKGYRTAKGQTNTQQSCQLAAAIVRLMLPLIRSNLKEEVDDIKEYCTVLKCLLLPQWGLPADAAKNELLKSGGLPLLLAALDKERGAAMGASLVLILLLGADFMKELELDPQMCSALLQMGAIERLSQLLHPVLDRQDSAKTEKLVKSAFRTAKWTVTSDDPSLEYLPGWGADNQCTFLCQTTALMAGMLDCGGKKKPQADAASASSTTNTPQAPTWPVPSSKEWDSISTVIIRVVALLAWLRGRVAAKDKQASVLADVLNSLHTGTNCSIQQILMQTLLQLLDRLLKGSFTAAGHLQSHLVVTHLLDAGLLDQALSAYTSLKLQQVADSSIQCYDDLVAALLLQATIAYKPPGKASDSRPVWTPTAAETILSCMGPHVQFFSSQSPAVFLNAMRFLSLAVDSLEVTNAMSNSPQWFGFFHTIITVTELENQLLAMTCLGKCCIGEQQCGDKVGSPCYYNYHAAQKHSFSRFLPAYRKAVQSDEPLSLESYLFIVQTLQVCAALPPKLVKYMEEDAAEILSVCIQLTNRLPNEAEGLTFDTILQLLLAMSDLLQGLPGNLATWFEKGTCRVQTDLLKLSYHKDAPASGAYVLQRFLLGRLMSTLSLPDPLQSKGCFYFGQHAFPLACEWLTAQIDQYSESGLIDRKRVLGQIPDAYLIMLGSYRQIYHTEAPLELIVQAVCSLLGYLYLSVNGHAATRQVARLMRVQRLDPPRAAKPKRKVSSKSDSAEHAQQPDEEQLYKSQIETLVDFFGNVAADAALVEGLKQKGPLSWCPQSERDVTQLARDLQYLTTSRGLPITTIRAVQSAFALTQVIDWEAAGKQLMEEEQQKAAKAAAKKAKKLRQKFNKQQTQQTQPAVGDSSLQNSSQAEAHDTDDDASQCVLNNCHFLAQPSPDLSAAPVPLDSQQTGFCSGQSSPTQASLAAHSVRHTFQPNGTACTAAVAVAGTLLPSSASTSSTAEPGAGQMHVPLDQQPSASDSNFSEAIDDDIFLQDLFRCPLTKATMTDCVIAADGYSYERAAIASWLQQSSASPVTGKPLQHKRLVPNVLLRQAMAVSKDSCAGD